MNRFYLELFMEINRLMQEANRLLRAPVHARDVDWERIRELAKKGLDKLQQAEEAKKYIDPTQSEIVDAVRRALGLPKTVTVENLIRSLREDLTDLYVLADHAINKRDFDYWLATICGRRLR